MFSLLIDTVQPTVTRSEQARDGHKIKSAITLLWSINFRRDRS